jgi:hypothetical protein
MAGDIYFNDVSLLLHCDGTNGSTTFTDSSNNGLTVTPNGNAQISTAQSKFGGASGYFDGSSSYVNTTLASALGTVDFTVEIWFYLTSTSAVLQRIIGSFGGYIGIKPTTNYLVFSSNGSDAIINSVATTLNTWTHVAISRNSSITKMFVNGVQVGLNYSDSISYIDLVTVAANYPLGTEPFFGYIDDVRITKGIARYTSNFTPPTSAFPDHQPYISGTLTESLAATDFKARVYQLSDGALVSDTTVTSSPYTLELQTLEPVLVTMLPDYGTQWAASTAYALNDKVFPTDPATSPYYYECTTAGTSDASEPTWPTSGTVNDGTAVWTYVEQMVQPITHGPLIPS